MKKNKLYEKYFESIYTRSNNLSIDEYENASKDYERLYGKFLDSKDKDKVLDIGCGAGHFLYYLKTKKVINFIGIDISAQQVEFCKANITKRVIQADIFEFLRKDKSVYKLIVANDLLEHIKNDKINEFLNLVFKSLSDQGTLVLRVPNMSNPFSLDSRYRDFTHSTGFTEKSLFHILFSIGFKDIQITSTEISVKSFRSFIRKIFVSLLHRFIKFLYYIQDFSVPNNLGKNLIVNCKKR